MRVSRSAFSRQANEVWPALFEILHTHHLRYPFPNDRNELVFEIHECKCQEYQLYILVSRFQSLLLRVDDLFLLQELISQLLPDQREPEESFVFHSNWLMS